MQTAIPSIDLTLTSYIQALVRGAVRAIGLGDASRTWSFPELHLSPREFRACPSSLFLSPSDYTRNVIS